LNKISPSSVPANQNATVTLTGDNFSSGNEVVNLNGVPLPPGSVTFNSATQLTVMIPAASIPSANIDNLSVSDTSVGQNSQSLTFVVTGAAPADFSLGTPNPGSRTVIVGQMAQYTIPVNSVNGFSGSVSFSCSSITPATSDFTCTAGSFLPNPLNVPANSSANTVLSITPTANARVPAAPGPRQPLGLWIFAVVLLAAGAVFLIPREGTRRRLAFGLALALAVALLVTMSACGGGSGGGGGGGGNSHTFKITVQGTAGNLNHTTNVTLTIH
jgi:IPT/TIG domain-containing protein